MAQVSRVNPCLSFQIKKLCASREKDSQFVVYEDMACGNPKTAHTSNVYQ